MVRNLIFKATYWSFEEDKLNNELLIYIGGLTRDNKTSLVRVKGFQPFVYLELPTRIKWTKSKCGLLFAYFQNRMKSEGPVDFKMYEKESLYYRRKMYTLQLHFPTQSAATYSFSKLFSSYKNSGIKKLFVEGVGNFNGSEFNVHEGNIDPILKFTAKQNIKLAGWMKVTENPIEEDLTEEDVKFSTCDIDMEVNWKNVIPYQPKSMIITKPKYCSFDIECYSENHNSKIPDPEIYENEIFQIIMIFGHFGDEEKDMKIILLSLYNPKEIEGVILYKFKTEKELLLEFANLINIENPDIFTGYNIMKFDWNYIIKRARINGITPRVARITRLVGQKAEEKAFRWKSSAYGEQNFLYLDSHGRTNMDVLPEIERNYRLSNYALKTVSEFFLSDTKEDISARQLFMSVQLSKEIGPLVRGKVSEEELSKIKQRIIEIFPVRKTHGVMKKLRSDLLNSNTSNIEELVDKAIWICGVYCKKDGLLPIWLSEKLNLWTTMEEMANVMNVPASYLHSRGQQVKVMAQLYRETLENNIIIPHKKYTDEFEKFQGATVFEAVPGDYDNVAVLDFASLYPTTMIAFNICYTTILKEDDPTPDEDCHVLIWEDHRGCEHDVQKRKCKKDKILCKSHNYRFKKVKIILKDNGEVEYKNEGIFPRLERKLLTERKAVKKEMFKAEARLAMHKGTANEKDIKYYKSQNWEILNKGQLSEKEAKILEVTITVLNAKQLALKVSANSMYGAMGAQMGFIPFIPGAASITAMGRRLIIAAVERIKKEYTFAKLVYGDTDSCMITFAGQSLKDSFDFSKKASKIATHYIKCFIIGVDENYTIKLTDGRKCRLFELNRNDLELMKNKADKLKYLEYLSSPIDLEFENMYGRFLLLTKKRYVAYVVNVEGTILSVTKKGVVITRRDNSEYLRLTYKKIATGILDRASEEEIMNIIYDRVNELFTRKIPDVQLIIYTGVKNIINYAKKKEVKNKYNNTLDNVPIDEHDDPIDDLIGPLDPRLIYPNLPQVLLTLKMIRRGDNVPPNTRLEYLYLENKDAVHQGDKAEDFTYYKENRKVEKLKPDRLHYIEKQLAKPITELLNVKFPRDPVPFEKVENARIRLLRGIESAYINNQIAITRVFIKKRPVPVISNCLVGWKALFGKKENEQNIYKLVKKGITKELKELGNSKVQDFEAYTFKGHFAKTEYVLESSKKTGKLEIGNLYPELVNVCKRWKSIMIIDRLYKKYNLKKRTRKHPSRSNHPLPIMYPVMLTRPIDKYRKGELCKIYNAHSPGIEDVYKLEKGNKSININTLTIFYDIIMEDDKVIEKLTKDVITTYLYKDDSVMKDILNARHYYKEVVDEFNGIQKEVEKSFINFIE